MLKSSTTTDVMSTDLATRELLPPVTPGEILLEEFLLPMGISQYRLAQALGVPATRINQLVKGQRAVTADTDLRMCGFFGLSSGFWLRLQAAHDLERASRELGDALKAITPFAGI
jgi:addiction module HigA family antidote